MLKKFNKCFMSFLFLVLFFVFTACDMFNSKSEIYLCIVRVENNTLITNVTFMNFNQTPENLDVYIDDDTTPNTVPVHSDSTFLVPVEDILFGRHSIYVQSGKIKSEVQTFEISGGIKAELIPAEKHYYYQYLHGEDVEFKLTFEKMGNAPSKVDIISAKNPEVVYAKDVPVVNGKVTLSTENPNIPTVKDSIPEYGFIFKSNSVVSNGVYIQLLEKEYEMLETQAWDLLINLTPEYSPYTFKLLDSTDPAEKDISKLAYYFDHGNKDTTNIVDLSNWTDVTDFSLDSASGGNSKTIELILPPNLEILDNKISEWTAIKKLTLPETIKDIDYCETENYEYINPFSGCVSLEEIIVSENNDYLKVVDGCLFSKDGKVLINYPSGKKEEKYTVPSGVEFLANESFRLTTNLKEVTVSEGVTAIGLAAFYNCENLETVNLPSSLNRTGISAFSGTNIKTITIPERLNLAQSDFSGAKKLQEYKVAPGNSSRTVEDGVLIEIDGTRRLYSYPVAKTNTSYKTPENIDRIEEKAFSNCAYLEKLEISEGVTTICKYAFFNCGSLKEIVFPENSLKSILHNAFQGCTGLTEIEIPWGITNIDYELFRDCKNLQKVVFPGTIKTIKHLVFENCSENLVVEIHATEPPECYADSFNTNQKIYVPDGALATYKNTEIWKDLNIEGKVF